MITPVRPFSNFFFLWFLFLSALGYELHSAGWRYTVICWEVVNCIENLRVHLPCAHLSVAIFFFSFFSLDKGERNNERGQRETIVLFFLGRFGLEGDYGERQSPVLENNHRRLDLTLPNFHTFLTFRAGDNGLFLRGWPAKRIRSHVIMNRAWALQSPTNYLSHIQTPPPLLQPAQYHAPTPHSHTNDNSGGRSDPLRRIQA